MMGVTQEHVSRLCTGKIPVGKIHVEFMKMLVAQTQVMTIEVQVWADQATKLRDMSNFAPIVIRGSINDFRKK